MRAGDIIKKKRIELGLTQAELGAMVGFSQQSITKFEKGERTIDENKIYRFAKVLKIDPAEFVNGSNANGSSITTINKIGFVEAGNWQEAFQLPQDEWEPVCYEMNDNIKGLHIFALGVRGNSMNRIFPAEKTTLICMDINDFYNLNADGVQNGDYVIAQRISSDGKYEATVKRFTRVDENTVILSPESTDESYKPIVITAANANDNAGYEIKAVVIDYQMKLKKL
ncbi:putative prophage repressor [Azospirillum sp. CAG:260]|jgi:putative prophage repressor|uniref:Helix-turn-helix domain-containing protein n=2 Tax=root TaxID=1 RepID=A0A9D1M462_9PROT|nr:putative prophage repressor [Azospirillum sp. CAG:260]DAE17626.1 MAG TPA: helix-turn-helix domain protein [Podoviridae sp. ctx0K11]DAG58215.1 MAG TPA: hypothetical protein [Caudoviricetes sp.]DAI27819.1 MAG TPA: helix-turn-helix domain protein [Caudoviricetes sp.]HIU53274.1 helix-turn-helix domain-containing protein [Candidatus Scatocola faecipullorum]